MATEVGSGYVSIIPSLRGFGSAIQSELTRELTAVARQISGALDDAFARAGQSGGQELGEQFVRGADGRWQDLRGRFVNEAQATGRQAGNQLGDGLANGIEAGAEEGGNSLSDIMTGAAAAAAAVAGATFAVSLAGAMEKESTSDLLAAQLGATPELSKQYGAIAGDLYKQAYGESFAEVSGAVGAVVSSIKGMNTATASEVQVASAAALDFAKVFEIDINRAVQSVGVLMNTGLVTDAQQAFDLMTAASQRVPAHLREDLLDASDEYGQFFKAMGFSGEQAFGLLAGAADKGAFGIDKMGDAIKESTLLMTDVGNTGVQDAYKAIGLDAQTMSNQLLAGGTTAQGAYQKIVLGLQGIKDPSAQAAAAVSLFGTPLEDLGKHEIPGFLAALGGIGPGLNNAGGAAARMGATMADNATTRITAFKREVESAFIDFIGNRALPVVETFVGFMATNFGPAFQSVNGWIGNNKGAVLGLAIALGSLLVVTQIHTAFLAVQAVGGLAAYFAQMSIVTAATRVWAAVQWALNAAFIASPIGWIVLAIAAVGAAVLLAWKHSETFRVGVMAAWAGIKSAAQAAWDGYLRPALESMRAFIMDRVVPAALWLWNNAIRPAFQGIATVAQWLWTSVLQPVFGFLVSVLQGIVIPVVLFLWRNVFAPAFDGIAFAVKLAWAVLQFVFSALVVLFKAVIAPVVMWLWNNVFAPAFSAIGALISFAWNNVIKPVFSALGNFITEKVAPAFRSGLDGISKAWDGLRDLAKKPVTFVVNSVINPLIRGWNSIAGKFGAPKVDEIGGFAAGGKVWGSGTETSDSILARLSRNEHVWTAAEVRGAGGHGSVMALRDLAKSGALKGALPGYADGGIVDWITDPIGTAKKKWGGILNGLSQISNTGFGQMVAEMPRKLWDKMLEKAKSLFTFGGGDVKGGAFGNWPSSPGAQRGDSGVWRSIVALINSTGPLSGSFGNAYRAGDPLWHGCVPMDTEILTRRGWVAYADVEIGVDETVGFNPVTGRSEWTPIVGMHYYESAELWAITDGEWTVEVTPGHKWLTHDGLVETRHLTKASRVRVATPLAADVDVQLVDEDVEVTEIQYVAKRRTDVFCPTTGLGTWTARQGGQVFLTGNSGRAVDWMGFNQDALATFLAAQKPLELIHRTNTRDYAYTRGKNKGSFSQQLMNEHRNHIHAAFDSGGLLQPGLTTAFNGTGAPEPVLTQQQWRTMRAAAEMGVAATVTPAGDIIHLHGVGPEGLAQLDAHRARKEALARAGRQR